MLKRLILRQDRILSPQVYPFTVPAIGSLTELRFSPARVTFFTGENGSGKSTLLEAIAAHYGFGREGGTRNFQFSTTESNHTVEPLVQAMQMAFDNRTGEGFFLRAESLFNVATHIDELDADGFGPRIVDSYGGVSLHTRSHGETFFTVLKAKFRRNGLFLLDEPEAALSPHRQLAFLSLMYETVTRFPNAQFLVSTHSPILLGYPGAQIFSFDGDTIHEIGCEESMPWQVYRRFLADPGAAFEDATAQMLPLFRGLDGDA
ncbi:AAA family ATPase [Terriglobus tenax]|uniref:AAA family ATPase n=1 Tax=Terriglobus tenax TaxID=1111115 RepID=UPI0021DF4B6D|nr:AAA family ATPase [Terriglobus tenax]